jgi:signal transduction histidine kinase
MDLEMTSGQPSLNPGDVDRLLLEHFAPPAVVIDEELRIVHYRGSPAAHVELGPGVASLDVLRLARQELRPALRQAVEQARQHRCRVRRSGLPVRGDPRRWVDIDVLPLAAPAGEALFLVVFQDSRALDVAPGAALLPNPALEGGAPGERIIRDQLRQIRDYQEKLRQMAFDAALTEERERRRIAADLHDQIGQALAVAQLELEALRDGSAEPAALDDAIELLARSSADVRTLLFELSPPILYDLGLGPAISWLAEDFGKRWGLAIEVQAEDDRRPLDELTATLAFRAVRELLSNVLKHAEATRARVTLRRLDQQLSISVEDQGVGFELEPATLSQASGFGLFSVREQISRLGGTLSIETASGQGTRVRLQLPLMGPRPPAPGDEPASIASTAAPQARQTADEGLLESSDLR